MRFEFSAGGVVYRQIDSKIQFLIVQHSGHHRWVLPKGWIEKGETKEEAAIREVKEEAGIEAAIEEYIGDFEVFYTDAEKEKVKKKNYFFLMKYKGGDPEKEHGWEVENVAWVEPKEAISRLDYPDEKKICEKASMILDQKLTKSK